MGSHLWDWMIDTKEDSIQQFFEPTTIEVSTNLPSMETNMKNAHGKYHSQQYINFIFVLQIYIFARQVCQYNFQLIQLSYNN